MTLFGLLACPLFILLSLSFFGCIQFYKVWHGIIVWHNLRYSDSLRNQGYQSKKSFSKDCMWHFCVCLLLQFSQSIYNFVFHLNIFSLCLDHPFNVKTWKFLFKNNFHIICVNTKCITKPTFEWVENHNCHDNTFACRVIQFLKHTLKHA